jgi:hypothetical protein
MKVTMSKEYRTRSGKPVEVLAVDLKGLYPVIYKCEGYAHYTYHDGRTTNYTESDYDLVEVSEFEDFKINDWVMVKFIPSPIWVRAHFAGVNSTGKPLVFAYARSYWTNEGTSTVACCRRPTKEELKEEV